MNARRAPTNCQQEPNYPGVETVMFAIGYPAMTCHYPSPRCAIQEPHLIAECGEFSVSAPTTGDQTVSA